MSSPAVSVRQALPEDAPILARALRQADKDEIDAAMPGRDYTRVVERSIRGSSMSWRFSVGDELAFVCGVAPIHLLGREGAPWLLGTDVAVRHARALMRLYPTYIARMLARFPVLENTVHSRNEASVRWLKRIGFEFGETFVSIGGEPFTSFRMTSHV